MKKSLLKKVILLTLIGILVVFSCEEPPPPIPDCERYGYGEVTVVNNTGYNAWVDVTYKLGDTNYEKLLYNNNSYSYKMDKGTVYIWISFDKNDWVFESEYLGACENMRYVWYLNKKKSTNNLVLEKYKNDILIQTITNFKWVNLN